jgi:NAD(P)-dependent dehydrogenase (short-subunit alcohol dehydrogenase family)
MKQRRSNHKVPRDSLAGKVSVVTGASRGIGLAITRALLNEGCAVVAAARTETSMRRLFASDPKVTPVRCDVRDEGSVERAFAAIKKQFKQLDFLVNNAGISHALAPVEKLSLEAWRTVLDTNLTGMFLCTRAALPLMRRGGVIINNLSVAARGVFAGESAYCASKFGALGFTDTLREELRERGIRVVALLPAATATEIWDQFMPEAPRERMMSPDTVAQAVIAALLLPDNVAVEEVRLAPVVSF